MPRPSFHPLLAALVAMACALPCLQRPSYWSDEAASLTMATRPWGDFTATIARVDVVHASYYTVLRLWIQVWGSSEAATRSLSMLAFGAAAAGVFVFARRASTVGWTAVAAFVALPGSIWIATEARGWALAAACVVWAMVALQRYVDSPQRRWLVLFALAMTAAVALNLYALLMAPMTVAWALHRGHPRGVVVAWASIALIVSPLVWRASDQTAQLNWNQNGFSSAVERSLLTSLFEPQYVVEPAWTAALLTAARLVCLAVLLLGLARRPAPTALGLAWWGVPTIVLVASTLVSPGYFTPRYLTFAVAGACVALGAGLTVLGPRKRVAAVAVLAAVTAPIHLAMTAPDAKGDGHDLRSLAAAARGADEVVHGTTTRVVAAGYPGDFDGIKDRRLVRSAASRHTIFGLDKAWRRTVPRTTGTVVAYVRMASPGRPIPNDTAMLDALLDQGCREQGDRTVTRFAQAVRLLCP